MNKQCNKCNEEKPITEFHKNGPSGYHPKCKSCRSADRKKLNYPRKEEDKECPGCEIVLSASEFDSDKQACDGLQTYCKTCKKKQQLKGMSTYNGFMKHIFKDLLSNAKCRKIDVNLDLDDIINLYTVQNKKCAISKKDMTHICVERSTTQHIINKWNISIDRIDSNKGYDKNNIQLVCSIVNRIKGELTDNEFLLLCEGLVQANMKKLYDIECNDESYTLELLYNHDLKSKTINITSEKNYKSNTTLEGHINRVYLQTRYNHTRRSKEMDFTITLDDIKCQYAKQDGKCALSRLQFTHNAYTNSKENSHNINKWNVSIDRIDSNKGYTKDNIQLVCAIINRMKTDLDEKEFLLLCNDIALANSDKITKLILDLLNN